MDARQGAGHEDPADRTPDSNTGNNMSVHGWSPIRGDLGAWVPSGTASIVLRPPRRSISRRWWYAIFDTGFTFNSEVHREKREDPNGGGGLRTGRDTEKHPKLVVQSGDGEAPTRIAFRKFRAASRTVVGIVLCATIAGTTIYERYRHLTHDEWYGVGIMLLVVLFTSFASGVLAAWNMRSIETIE